jgi:hypothetical protein
VVAGESLTAPARLAVDLQNGPDALRLVRRGAILDLLGYGSLSDPSLCEGRPAADAAGASLARIPDGHDTGDNAADFAVRPPSPGRRNRPERDLSVTLAAPDPTRSWPGRRLVAAVTLRNAGLVPLRVDACSLGATMRSFGVDGDAPGIDWPVSLGAVPRSVASGDSARLVLDWTGSAGLYRLAIGVDCADEDANNDTAGVWVRVGSGPVVVNEILFAPETGAPEWLELWNRSDRAQELAGWTVEDGGAHRARLRCRRALAPGGFAVVAADSLAPIPALASGTLRIAATPWPGLNNSDGPDGTADAVVLRDARGIVVDGLRYSASAVPERGWSIERLLPDPDVRGLLWASCKARERSTPGRANSATAPPAADIRLRVEPNPFSPDGDGRADLLGIAFQVPAGCDGFRARLYDLEGRKRADLGADRLGPGPRHLVWEGRDNAGIALPTGVYVMHLEFHSKISPALSERRVLGLVRP